MSKEIIDMVSPEELEDFVNGLSKQWRSVDEGNWADAARGLLAAIAFGRKLARPDRLTLQAASLMIDKLEGAAGGWNPKELDEALMKASNVVPGNPWVDNVLKEHANAAG